MMKSNKTKSIGINALLNGTRTLINLLFPLITFPYITRVLSQDEIGKYNFSNSIISYFLLIAALGIDKYAIREGTKYRDDRQKFSEFASEVFSINIFSTILSYVLLFIYLTFSNKAHNYYYCILIFSLQIFFTTIGTEWLYSIYEEYSYITVRSIIFKIISMILLFCFVRHEGDYLKYTGITVFASVGSNVLNYINSKKYCKIRFTLHIDWKRMLIPILTIFAANIAVQIYVNSDTTMLGYLQNDRSVALYSISVKIYTIVKTLIVAVLTVSIPRFSLYAGMGRQDDYDSLMQKISNVLIALSVPATVGLIILSKDIVLLIGGYKYLDSYSSLSILSIAIFLCVFSTLLTQCVLLPYKMEKFVLQSSIISALENIALNFILIPMFAENGAAITTVLAELTVVVMNYCKCRYIVKRSFFNKKTAKNAISVIVGSILIYIVCHFCVSFISNIALQTFSAIILSVLAYGITLIIFKNPIIGILIETVKKK